MERLHYQAKGSYFKTQHGSGVTKSNVLHEMFNWFYKTLSGQKNAKCGGILTLRRRVKPVVSVAHT